MKKILFIDRDGTIIREPEDYQIDSLEKLEFVPYAISSIKKLQDQWRTLVMVSNQDGLGTRSFPTEDFEKPQNKMMEILSGEGIIFEKVFIDPSLPEENSPNRKPRTGMLDQYMKENDIDKVNSFVIGDRESDMEFAKNLWVKGRQINEKENGRKKILQQIIYIDKKNN